MSFFVKYLSIAVIASIFVYGVTPYLVNAEKAPGAARKLDQVLSSDSVKKISRGGAGASEEASDSVARGGRASDGNYHNYTPSTDTIPLSGPDVEQWGVALRNAALFEQDGKRREDKLAGGTLVEQVGVVRSSRGGMAKVRVWRDSRWAGPYLVSPMDLMRFDDRREDYDAESVTSLCSYYALSAQLEQRREELRQEAACKNPYYADLKEAATLYNTNIEDAKRMTKERDNAQGSKRTQIADKLRRMEVENKKLATKVKTLTKKYETWKKNNGMQEAAYDNDSRCRSLSTEMEKLKPRLSLFGF